MRIIEKVYADKIPESIDDPLGGTFGTGANTSQVLGVAFNILLGVGWGLVFICLGITFIKYILSKGDPKETATARTWLLYIAIGTFIMFFITVFRGIAFDLIGANRGWQINNVTNHFTP